MKVDDDLSELFFKEKGKAVDNTNQPYSDDYVRWLESKVNNVVLDDVNRDHHHIKCDNPHCDDGIVDVIYGEPLRCSNCDDK